MYILRPIMGDMELIKLGSSIKQVKKVLRERRFEEVFDYPEDYDDDYVKQVHKLIDTDYKKLDDLIDDLEELEDEYRVVKI